MTTGTGTTTGTTGTGLTSLAGALALGTASAMSAVTTPAACTAVPTDQAAVTTAKSTVVADQGAVDAAESKKDVDDESGRLAVANAQQGVVSAQNATNSATSDRPPSIAQQAAAVAAAQSVVASANRDVDNTTLRAPVDGVVSVLNGAVGEFVAPSTGTSALAPGTDATLPGTDGTSGAAAAGAATPTRPGGTQFLVLDNIDEFQVVLAFTETDAANITPGQKVKVTFDAVPDLTLDGSVLSSAPTGTAISGVISYYVTVVLPKSDPRLRSGMTAEAEVLTKEIPDVLAVPSASVHTQSGRSTVTVLESDGTQRAIPVQTGATGDGNTQILTGLTEGQQVVLPATP
jgi:HlyD family secretion protein